MVEGVHHDGQDNGRRLKGKLQLASARGERLGPIPTELRSSCELKGCLQSLKVTVHEHNVLMTNYLEHSILYPVLCMIHFCCLLGFMVYPKEPAD